MNTVKVVKPIRLVNNDVVTLLANLLAEAEAGELTSFSGVVANEYENTQRYVTSPHQGALIMNELLEALDYIHVYPLFGREHDTDHGPLCWCQPEAEPDAPEVLVHKAEQ